MLRRLTVCVRRNVHPQSPASVAAALSPSVSAACSLLTPSAPSQQGVLVPSCLLTQTGTSAGAQAAVSTTASASSLSVPTHKRRRRRPPSPSVNTAAQHTPPTPPSMGQQQQQQQQSLLLSPAQQQQLLESVRDRLPVIFYHYPCADGVFAALAATLYYRQRGVTPQFVPHEVYKQVSLQELQLQPNAVAFLLDYSGPEGFPQQLARHVSQVVVLDHHKTALQQLSDVSSHPANLAVHLDMKHSGAAIARDFFRPQGLSSSLQDVYRWVEDADLWTWALPESQAFHAGLAALKLDYHAGRNPDIWQQLQELDIQHVMDKGAEALRYQEQLVSQAVASSTPYQLGGSTGAAQGWGSCLGVEVTGDVTWFRSKLGNSLAQLSKERGMTPVGLVAYTEAEQPNADTHTKVSLRSIDGFDTSAVSRAFGGGGHAAASSCIIRREDLKQWQAAGEGPSK